MPRIVLASQSPSRLAILRSAGVEPVVRPANVDERAIEAAHTDPRETVQALAVAKAAAISPDFPDDVVIGCDSLLLIDGHLQGKPHTPEATVDRWRQQAGRSAELLTGHCITFRGESFVDTGATRIDFAAASDKDIEAYARTGEPLECAGAFTLEALGGWFIDRIEGDPSSVIGLSLPLVRRALYSFGLDASDFWGRDAGGAAAGIDRRDALF